MRPRGRRERVLRERFSSEPGHNPGEMLRGKATEWGLRHLMRVFGKVRGVADGGSEESEAGWGWGERSDSSGYKILKRHAPSGPNPASE